MPSLLEDFPKNHNLVLIGQLELISMIKKREHEEIHSRITMTEEFKPLAPADIISFIHRQLDRCGLYCQLIDKVTFTNKRAMRK